MKSRFSSLNYTIVDSGDTDILSRIKDSIKYIRGQFMLCYGDTISDIDIDKLMKFHEKSIDKVTISSYPLTVPFGVMNVNSDNLVEEFNEKPTLNGVINIGYYLFNQIHLDMIKSKSSIIDLISSLISNKKLQCYQHTGVHITVNTLSELENANENIKKIS